MYIQNHINLISHTMLCQLHQNYCESRTQDCHSQVPQFTYGQLDNLTRWPLGHHLPPCEREPKLKANRILFLHLSITKPKNTACRFESYLILSVRWHLVAADCSVPALQATGGDRLLSPSHDSWCLLNADSGEKLCQKVFFKELTANCKLSERNPNNNLRRQKLSASD